MRVSGGELTLPMPRVVPRRVVRWASVAALRAMWSSTDRLDLVLPTGERVRLGPPGRADATARIHNDRAFQRILLRGELGAGEAFTAGEWSADTPDALVDVLRVFLRATRARGLESPFTRLFQLQTLLRHRLRANTVAGSARNIHAHYDLGNAFYRLFLDPETLAYSCAIYPAPSLADAQRLKFDRLCDWLALSPRDHLLEIGCGWGGMAVHAAKTRGCRVTAITVSREQRELAAAVVAREGLADRVAIELRDYRALDGRFDKVVSIEMLEAVGYEYLESFFATCARVAPGGPLALQSITMPHDRFDAYRKRVDWMQTYIFPGSLIPSIEVIARAARSYRITRTDDIGPSYAPTLREWRRRFIANLPRVRELFDEAFARTWLLYLAFSEAAFSERTLQNHQLLLTSRA